VRWKRLRKESKQSTNLHRGKRLTKKNETTLARMGSLYFDGWAGPDDMTTREGWPREGVCPSKVWSRRNKTRAVDARGQGWDAGTWMQVAL